MCALVRQAYQLSLAGFAALAGATQLTSLSIDHLQVCLRCHAPMMHGDAQTRDCQLWSAGTKDVIALLPPFNCVGCLVSIYFCMHGLPFSQAVQW